MFIVQFVIVVIGKPLGPLVLRGLSGEQPDWGSCSINNGVSVELQRFYSLSHRLKAVPAPSKRGSQGVVRNCKLNAKLKFESHCIESGRIAG